MPSAPTTTSTIQPRPRFAAALDNADPVGDGSWIADCPICRDLLLIEPRADRWRLTCDSGQCTHDELVLWLKIADCRVHPSRDNRAWVALMLAPTPEIWQALLDGEHVAEEALDQRWLARFKKAGVV